MAQQLAHPENSSSETNPRLRGMRILVVEDWWIVAQELRARLEQLECEVVGPAPTVDKALTLAANSGLDGAILDVDLNGRRVYPVADLLLTRGIPFFFATGFDSPHVTDHYHDIPQLRKPYALHELKAMMVDVFARGREEH